MLVLTRRSDESIVFPNAGITIKILKVDGRKAKIGIDAPKSIRIIRNEAMAGIEEKLSQIEPGTNADTNLHRVRNRLNTVNLAVHLYQQQMAAGQLDAANLTFLQLVDDLESIDREMSQGDVVKQKPPAFALQSPKMNLLLVEDDVRQRDLLGKYLSSRGCVVATAGNGEDAMDYLQTNARPDFVLLDLRLPGAGGAATVRRMRSHNKELSPLKIFAVSGTSPGELGISTDANGVDKWFPKPTNPERLIEYMSATCSV